MVPVDLDAGGGQDGVVVTTGAPPPANLGPPPEEVPAAARQVVTLRPGGAIDPAHLEFIEAQDGYVDGSAKVEAVYPGALGPKAIVTWQSNIGECRTIAAAGVVPEGWGCGSGFNAEADNALGGMGYTTEASGFNMIEVEHTPGVAATVVELTDGTIFVIRPGESSISYHEWNGAPSARITVFWPDGTSESALTSP